MSEDDAERNNNKDPEAKINAAIKSRTVDAQETRGRCKRNCGLSTLVILIFFNIICGIFLLRVSLYEILMADRMLMRPGMPAYEFWKNPEPEVIVKMHVFNITNAEDFLAERDSKIKLAEVGPVVYQEILKHTDVVFNENSTLSYKATKTLVYREDLNEPGILNETIIVPNMATLGIASYLNDAGYFVNLAAKSLMYKYDEEPLRKMTVYDYLWNYKSDVLSTAKIFGGSVLVPVENMGVLYNIYKNWSDHLNVKMGPKYPSSEFFHLLSYNYRTTVPGFKLEHGDCNATILEATEGAIYPQRLTKNSTLFYWRKTLCRPATLFFEEEVQKGPLLGYKYVLRNDVYDHPDDKEDCYRGKNLPDGLSDLQKCFHNFPVAASKPHFYGRNGSWMEKLSGLSPKRELHDSYVIVEPQMGTPIDQVARSQSNLIIKQLSVAYPLKMRLFSDTILPMFWVEIHQPDLTPLIKNVINFTINILPKYEGFLGPICLVSALVFTIILIKCVKSDKNSGKKIKLKKGSI
ncbi:lysosome membrane protein 2-like [Culicoides brevitarsis]|uniref:lysosome membrane protein 2-like n=1 Tax=Culicoides brevitarsis TaxID=469753 RepID=UPI00307C1474